MDSPRWISCLLVLSMCSVFQLTGACDFERVEHCLDLVVQLEAYRRPHTEIIVEKCMSNMEALIASCYLNRNVGTCTEELQTQLEVKKEIIRETLCQLDAGVCNITNVNQCLSRQGTPSVGANVQACTSALNTIAQTLTCVETNTRTCSEDDKRTAMDRLNTIRRNINTRCGNKQEFQCAELGFKYSEFEKCSPLIGQAASDIIDEWNFLKLQVDGYLCARLSHLRGCIDSSTRDCGVLSGSKLTELYQDSSNRFIKQALEICGTEIDVYPTLPTCSSQRLSTLRSDILANCEIPADAYTNKAVTSLCLTFQNQIDCIIDRSQECSELIDEFIRPRAIAYGLINERFCVNITIAGVAFSSTDPACNYEAIAGCLSNFVLSLSGVAGANLNPEALQEFFGINRFTDDTGCIAFKHADWTRMLSCQNRLVPLCNYAMPLTPTVYTPDLRIYDGDILQNMQLGPIPQNKYGIWYLQMKYGFLCFECENAQQLKADLVPCVAESRDLAEQIDDLPRADSDTPQCSTLQTKVMCIANVTRTCTIYIKEAELLFDEIRSAMDTCGINRNDIYPLNFLTTPPPPPPPSTTPRTFSYTTTTTGPTVGGGEQLLVSVFLLAASIVVSMAMMYT